MSWFRSLGKRGRLTVPEATAVDDFYRSLLLHVEPELLHASALARLAELSGCEDVALVLLDPERGDLRVQAVHGSWPETLRAASWSTEGFLARWLAINKRPLLLEADDEVVEDLAVAEKRVLTPSVEVVVPLEAASRLCGFLLLGPTTRPEGWTRELAAMLGTLAVPAALAFEHAWLVRERSERLHRLYRAERLATAGTLAAGLAHEIRNPLTAIRTGIQVVRDSDETAPETAGVLDDVIHEVDRIDRLVSGLLMFARGPRSAREAVDLTDIARRAALLVQPGARSGGVRVETRLDGCAMVEGDPGELEQVVLNLLLNAIEALDDGGEVVLEVSDGEQAGERRVLLEVRDTGPGLPGELGDRVFDPFVTTKREGSGLGLPISFQIVRRHGGDLSVTDRAGGGAVARVSLPAISEAT